MFLTAISICFQMTDVFRSEILAVVMQQIMDEPVLPILFLCTVNPKTSHMQTVRLTCCSFSGHSSCYDLQNHSQLRVDNPPPSSHVSSPKKKIWTNPPLWEGFKYLLRQGDCPSKLRGTPPITEGSAPRTS